MGDVHPLGNPHFWLDPENGKIVARDVAAKLAQLRPNDKAYFDQLLADFAGRLDAAEKRWLAALAPYKGVKVVTYHRSYPNFADRFGLDVIGYVEAGVARPIHDRDELLVVLRDPRPASPDRRRAFLDDHFRGGDASARIVAAIRAAAVPDLTTRPGTVTDEG
jgi:hypothetical protein